MIYSPQARAIASSLRQESPSPVTFDAMVRPMVLADVPGVSRPQDMFFDRVQSGQPFLTDLLYDPTAERYLLAVGVPVVARDQVVAVIVANVLPESLTSVLREQDLEQGSGQVRELLEKRAVLAGAEGAAGLSISA